MEKFNVLNIAVNKATEDYFKKTRLGMESNKFSDFQNSFLVCEMLLPLWNCMTEVIVHSNLGISDR